ncbi:MAG: YkgJ family cysteine cluster protein [Vampirovibrionales bacterium]|nr:YkgJ family cysteine cluster protein [Vampirovibrionales bacterium]
MYDMNYYGTQDDPGAQDETRADLPDFCHKCGRCCRSATTYAPYEELQEMAARGEAEAIEFLSIFQPYETLEDARAAVPDQVDQVLREAEHNPDLQGKKLTFYHCRYVTPEGLCGIYETRPRCCREAPAHGWSVMPPGCGFEGWQFLQREKQKRAIRDLKTSAYVIEQMSPDGKTHPLRPETTLDELRAMVQKSIRPWKRFGADYW